VSRVYDNLLLRNPMLQAPPVNGTMWLRFMREFSRYTNNGYLGAINMDVDAVRFDRTGAGVPPAVVVVPVASTVYCYQFSGAALNELFFTLAVPEWFRSDTHNLVFHVHWGPTSAVAGQVVWKVDYIVSDPGTALAGPAVTVAIPTTGWVATGGVADAHIVTDLTAIAGSALMTATAATGTASMLLGRLYRDSVADANDTYAAASWMWRLEAKFTEV
jgi:hypothetical protein